MAERRRVLLIILDGVGVGALPDAHEYGDQGSNTLLHTALYGQDLYLPNLEALGLSHLLQYPGSMGVKNPVGSYGIMHERSRGKDTTTGHWELAGLITTEPFPVFPKGFPEAVIQAFEKVTGYSVLGNQVASGTEILVHLGAEHIETGKPILYTSADSVFQLAAHEEVIPPDVLYDLCQKARAILQGEYGVARVIARPFRGETGSFVRTKGRKDFSLAPPEKTILDHLQEANHHVRARGKIENIFAGQGITSSVPGVVNREILAGILQDLQQGEGDLLFANLVEFDMLYGHRNDPTGFARALMELDDLLQGLYLLLTDGDILILTADHGCDPAYPGTDHTREQVPLLVVGKGIKKGVHLGTRKSFADVAATLAQIFQVPNPGPGESFWNLIIEGGFLCH